MTIILIVFFSGCLDFGGNDKSNKNAVIMTAKEHNNDLAIKTNLTDGYSILYKSLDNGNKLIYKDSISNLFYDEKIDETKVTFGWGENGQNDFFRPLL